MLIERAYSCAIQVFNGLLVWGFEDLTEVTVAAFIGELERHIGSDTLDVGIDPQLDTWV